MAVVTISANLVFGVYTAPPGHQGIAVSAAMSSSVTVAATAMTQIGLSAALTVTANLLGTIDCCHLILQTLQAVSSPPAQAINVSAHLYAGARETQ